MVLGQGRSGGFWTLLKRPHPRRPNHFVAGGLVLSLVLGEGWTHSLTPDLFVGAGCEGQTRLPAKLSQDQAGCTSNELAFPRGCDGVKGDVGDQRLELSCGGPIVTGSLGVRALDWIPALVSSWVIQALGLCFPI